MYSALIRPNVRFVIHLVQLFNLVCSAHEDVMLHRRELDRVGRVLGVDGLNAFRWR